VFEINEIEAIGVRVKPVGYAVQIHVQGVCVRLLSGATSLCERRSCVHLAPARNIRTHPAPPFGFDKLVGLLLGESTTALALLRRALVGKAQYAEARGHSPCSAHHASSLR
jgi:hypothetical protein